MENIFNQKSWKALIVVIIMMFAIAGATSLLELYLGNGWSLPPVNPDCPSGDSYSC